jgi:hypothetical protein
MSSQEASRWFGDGKLRDMKIPFISLSCAVVKWQHVNNKKLIQLLCMVLLELKALTRD